MDMAATSLARTFHTQTGPLINTGASARWRNARSGNQLFQQFVRPGEKPLKRLVVPGTALHRAKAPVLMRIWLRTYEVSGLERGRSRQ
jgi:hypothetical protein